MVFSVPVHFQPATSARHWSFPFAGPAKAGTLAAAASALLTVPTALPNCLSFSRAPGTTLFAQGQTKLTLWSPLRTLSRGIAPLKAESSEFGSVLHASDSTDSTDSSTSGKAADDSATEANVTEAGTSNGHTDSSNSVGQLIFKAAAAMIPHPDKAYRGGEDAYFIGEDGLSLGVSDGVGGWADVNVDPGIYSRLLMSNCKEAAKDMPASQQRTRDILLKGHSQTDVKGSATACVATLEGSNLHATNLGDSGFMVVRKDEIVLKSLAQQHQFNFPYQIAGPDCGSDPPESADDYKFELQRGDVVVLATDGVSDNLFPEEAAAIVSVIHRRGEPPRVAATGLANYASMRAQSKTHMSPFSVGAKQVGWFHRGGKLDDITVVVAYIADASKL